MYAFNPLLVTLAAGENPEPGITFGMTAGTATYFSIPAVGYNADAGGSGGFSPWANFGSIDAEPLATGDLLTLVSFVQSGSNLGAVYFSGDRVSELSGLSVWVDTTEYPFTGVDWTYSGENGKTYATWSHNTGPVFANTVSYDIEIK